MIFICIKIMNPTTSRSNYQFVIDEIPENQVVRSVPTSDIDKYSVILSRKIETLI